MGSVSSFTIFVVVTCVTEFSGASLTPCLVRVIQANPFLTTFRAAITIYNAIKICTAITI